MDQKTKGLIGLFVAIIIIGSSLPSLMAKPSSINKMAPIINTEKEQPNRFLFFSPVQTLLLLNVLAADQAKEDDAPKPIKIYAEIVILRPSSAD